MTEFIKDFYGNYDEEGRLLSRHGQVEFLTTMRYIDKYIAPGARVLEVGAGTGRYSHALARRGYAVDAVELVPHNIEIFNRNTEPMEKVNICQGDARDLSAFSDEKYDLVLVLGPLYHMYTREDKYKTISEALRVTKPGGIVFCAYCMSDATLFEHAFKKGGIDVAEYIRLGKIDPITYKTHSDPEDLFEIVRREDVEALMNDFPVERLHFVASDLYTNHIPEVVDAMDDDVFEQYLAYHFAVCERPDMTGLSHHTLDVFRKL